MANQSSSCFLCYVEFPGNLSTKFCSNEESSFLLNYILELPHWEDKVERVKFQQAKYCAICAKKIGQVRDVLEELDILEKQVLQQKYEIELQLKESWEKSQSQHLSQTKNPMDKLRDEIVSELKSSSAVSMLTKLKENQVGKKFRSREFTQNTSNPGFLDTNCTNTYSATACNKRARLKSRENPTSNCTSISISTMNVPPELTSVRINRRPETSTVTPNFMEGGEEVFIQEDIVIKEEPEEPSAFPTSYPSEFPSTETEFYQPEYNSLTSDGYHYVSLDNRADIKIPHRTFKLTNRGYTRSRRKRKECEITPQPSVHNDVNLPNFNNASPNEEMVSEYNEGDGQENRTNYEFGKLPSILSGRYFNVTSCSVDGKVSAQCLKCPSGTKQISGSMYVTSNFVKHLKRMHQEDYMEFQDRQKQLSNGRKKKHAPHISLTSYPTPQEPQFSCGSPIQAQVEGLQLADFVSPVFS